MQKKPPCKGELPVYFMLFSACRFPVVKMGECICFNDGECKPGSVHLAVAVQGSFHSHVSHQARGSCLLTLCNSALAGFPVGKMGECIYPTTGSVNPSGCVHLAVAVGSFLSQVSCHARMNLLFTSCH